MLNLDITSLDQVTNEKSMYPIVTINRGDDSGKIYGFEAPFNDFGSIILDPTAKWEDAPHPTNKWGGTDLAVMFRSLTVIPIAAHSSWHYAVKTGEKDASGDDVEVHFNFPKQFYVSYADQSIGVSGVTNLFCLVREISNTPIIIKARGMVAKSLNAIIAEKRGVFFNTIEKRMIVLSKRTLSANDLTLPLKVCGKEKVNGGWYRPLGINLSDEQLEQLKTMSFEEFVQSPLAKLLIATEEEKSQAEALKQAAMDWAKGLDDAIMNGLANNPYANFLFALAQQRLHGQADVIALLQKHNESPDRAFNELMHNINVKQLTA